MKLGLYGGAFNPIHRCHLQVAEIARARLNLDSVLFIPIGDPPHKPPTDFFPAQHRLEMVRMAITPFPYFQLSEIETRRPSKSYSIDTVNEIKHSVPPATRLVFIIGLDAFIELPSWKDPERLLAACDFAVLSRPGHLFRLLEDFPFFDQVDPDQLERLDRGQVELEEFPLRGGRSLWAMPIPPCHASSQEIRKRLKHKQSLENLLPAGVESYIFKHLLPMGESLR
jgi:nicotinate-nucleotide adenylyltransferase